MPSPSPKTLEDLAKQVVDQQQGLMSVDDLRVFFEDTPVEQNPTLTPTAEPVIAPVPPASPVTPAPTAEPVVSNPISQDFVPERFRGVDVQDSVAKMTKSYTDLEAELKKEREERAKLDSIIQGVPAVPASVAEPTPTTDFPTNIIGNAAEGEVDDSMFFDKPTESTKKVASQVAAAMLIAYHNALSESSKRIQYIEAFKASHPDFTDYKEDIALILKSRPDLDKRVENLPIVYEMAKARYRSRLDKMRKELG